MQGRLLPPTAGRFQCFPRNIWEQEFPLASQAGLECIEWIYDGHGEDVNPIATSSGVKRIQTLTESSGIGVHSICADWFMDYPLVRVDPGEFNRRVGKLEWLLGQCHELGVTRIVVPFVDASRIDTEQEMDQVVKALRRVIPAMETSGVEIHLETSLAPDDFRTLLDQVPHPLIKVNYDSGNSASLGFPPALEFSSYGQRIGSIHIKDRTLAGGTVPLGTGDADFQALFSAVADVEYRGDFILQAARGVAGAEVAWAQANRAWVMGSLAAAGVTFP